MSQESYSSQPVQHTTPRIKRKPPPSLEGISRNDRLETKDLRKASFSLHVNTADDHKRKSVYPEKPPQEMYPSPPASPATTNNMQLRHARADAIDLTLATQSATAPSPSTSRFAVTSPINTSHDNSSTCPHATALDVLVQPNPAFFKEYHPTSMPPHAFAPSIESSTGLHSHNGSASQRTSTLTRGDRNSVQSSFTSMSNHHLPPISDEKNYNHIHSSPPHYHIRKSSMEPPTPTSPMGPRFKITKLLSSKKSLNSLKAPIPAEPASNPPFADLWSHPTVSAHAPPGSSVLLPTPARRFQRNSDAPSYTQSDASHSLATRGETTITDSNLGHGHPSSHHIRRPVASSSAPSLPLVPNRFRESSLRASSLKVGHSKRSKPPPLPFEETTKPTEEQLRTASSMIVIAENGLRIPFGDLWKNQKTVICFLRHFWCPLCQDYMFSISQNVDPQLLEKEGVPLIIISNGSPNMIKSYRHIFRTPFPIFTDPTLRLYEALGMTLKTLEGGPETDKGSYVRHGTVSGTCMVVANALKVRMPVWEKGGEIAQLGGEFVLGPGLTCAFAHRMKTTRSHAPIVKVIAAAGVDMFAHAEQMSTTERSFLDLSPAEEARWILKSKKSLAKLKLRDKSLLADQPCGPDACAVPESRRTWRAKDAPKLTKAAKPTKEELDVEYSKLTKHLPSIPTPIPVTIPISILKTDNNNKPELARLAVPRIPTTRRSDTRSPINSVHSGLDSLVDIIESMGKGDFGNDNDLDEEEDTKEIWAAMGDRFTVGISPVAVA